ncbi:MAG: hypothetical protein PHD15_05710 [Clostridia bacterium]|nr:hypothetical protein [Clostridia bacterium]MDD4387228.1 hypothetical protein [Clostridia bacterium]
MATKIVDDFKTTVNWNNCSNFLDSNTLYNDKKTYAKAAITTTSTLYVAGNLATNVLKGLPTIAYTPGPTLQYAGISGSVATAGAITITAGTVSTISTLGNMSLIAGVNNNGNNNNLNNKNKINDLSKNIKDLLGKDTKIIINKNGDKIFISKDGTRRVRFDINNPSPHQSPHAHIEELVNGAWKKTGPVYPTDVPHK